MPAGIDEAPILESTNTKPAVLGTNAKQISAPFCKLNRAEILKVFETVNTGLASKELVILLDM